MSKRRDCLMSTIKIICIDNKPDEMENVLVNIRQNLPDTDNNSDLDIDIFNLADKELNTTDKIKSEIDGCYQKSNEIFSAIILSDWQIESINNEKIYYDNKDRLDEKGLIILSDELISFFKEFNAVICDISFVGSTGKEGIKLCSKLENVFGSDLLPFLVTSEGLSDDIEDLSPHNIPGRPKDYCADYICEWLKDIYHKRKCEPEHKPPFALSLNRHLLQGPIDTLYHGRDFCRYMDEENIICINDEDIDNDGWKWIEKLINKAKTDLNIFKENIEELIPSINSSLNNFSSYLEDTYNDFRKNNESKISQDEVIGRFKKHLKYDCHNFDNYLRKHFLRVESNKDAMKSQLTDLLSGTNVNINVFNYKDNIEFIDITVDNYKPRILKGHIPTNILSSLIDEILKYCKPNNIFSLVLENDKINKLLWVISHDGLDYENEEKLLGSIRSQNLCNFTKFANMFVATKFTTTGNIKMYEVPLETDSKARLLSNPMIHDEGATFKINELIGSAYIFLIPTVEQQCFKPNENIRAKSL